MVDPRIRYRLFRAGLEPPVRKWVEAPMDTDELERPLIPFPGQDPLDLLQVVDIVAGCHADNLLDRFLSPLRMHPVLVPLVPLPGRPRLEQARLALRTTRNCTLGYSRMSGTGQDQVRWSISKGCTGIVRVLYGSCLWPPARSHSTL